MLRGNWPLALAALVGAVAAWLLKPNPQPAVHEQLTSSSKSALHEDDTTHADVGGWTRTTYDYAPSSNEGKKQEVAAVTWPQALVFTRDVIPLRVTVEQHDPVVIERHSVTDAHQESAQKLDLTISPAAVRQFQVGFDDLPALILRRDFNSLRLAGRMRLFSRLWGEASTSPLHRNEKGEWRPQIGAAAAIEF